MNSFLHKINLPLARLALFLIYFWFGLLKVVGESPANSLIKALFNQTIAKNFHFIAFPQFFIAFGVFEMLIGLLFLIPRFERIAFSLLVLHVFTTVLPLFILPKLVWQKQLVPTLEGQYILKNILIFALGLNIFTHRR